MTDGQAVMVRCREYSNMNQIQNMWLDLLETTSTSEWMNQWTSPDKGAFHCQSSSRWWNYRLTIPLVQFIELEPNKAQSSFSGRVGELIFATFEVDDNNWGSSRFFNNKTELEYSSRMKSQQTLTINKRTSGRRQWWVEIKNNFSSQ